jgi:hypothetical protein
MLSTATPRTSSPRACSRPYQGYCKHSEHVVSRIRLIRHAKASGFLLQERLSPMHSKVR